MARHVGSNSLNSSRTEFVSCALRRSLNRIKKTTDDVANVEKSFNLSLLSFHFFRPTAGSLGDVPQICCGDSPESVRDYGRNLRPHVSSSSGKLDCLRKCSPLAVEGCAHCSAIVACVCLAVVACVESFGISGMVAAGVRDSIQVSI